jgi:transcriptional regulator with XRE-family HTH domain
MKSMAEHTLTAKELKELRKLKKLTQQAFADKLGITRELYGKMETGKQAISKATNILIENYLKSEFYPELDSRGAGLSGNKAAIGNDDKITVSSNRDLALHKPHMVPFYDAPAMAGDMSSDMMAITEPSGWIDTGGLFGRGVQMVICIHGNSMLPGYPSGTYIGLIQDYDSFYLPGELYVLETRSKRIFKRLLNTDPDPDIIICRSDNQGRFSDGSLSTDAPYYPDFKVHKQDVVRRFIVVGSARMHANSVLIR